MSVQTSEAAEPVGSHSHTFEIRQHYAVRVADHDVFHISIAVNQHADLAVDFPRGLRELPCKLVGNDLARWDTAIIELLKTVNLIGFESLKIPFDAADSCALRSRISPDHSSVHQRAPQE
jgi:hypothetical protein